MKAKTKLATAVILGLIATTGAQAAPTVYGALDVSVDYMPVKRDNVKDRDVVKVNTNTSFVGLKGSEKLNDRLSAEYQIDFTINADGDNDNARAITNRTRFVGLKDEALGTLRVGQQDTPLKLLSSAVDTFNSRVGNAADVGGIMTGENRIANSVTYIAPAIKLGDGKVTVSALTATGENGGVSSVSGGYKVAGRGLGDAFSASVVYSQPAFVLGVGYDKAIPSRFLGSAFLNANTTSTTTTTVDVAGCAVQSACTVNTATRTTTDSNTGVRSFVAAADTLRLTGRYNFKEQGLAVKALYQVSEVSNQAGNATAAANIDQAVGWLVGAEYVLPSVKAVTLKGQYSQNDTSFKNNTADYKAKQIFVGADYAFNKQASAYVQAGYLTLKQGNAEDKQPLFGTGFLYKF